MIWWTGYAVLHGACLIGLLLAIIRFADWEGPAATGEIDLIHYLWWPSSVVYYMSSNKPDILEGILIILPSIMWGGILASIHFGIRKLTRGTSQQPDGAVTQEPAPSAAP